MKVAPNLINAKIQSDGKVHLEYENGKVGEVDLLQYFKNLAVESVNLNKEFNVLEVGDFEIDANILYSILTMEPIVFKGKKVFDPKLGHNAWL